jgi:hypothetical protein
VAVEPGAARADVREALRGARVGVPRLPLRLPHRVRRGGRCRDGGEEGGAAGVGGVGAAGVEAGAEAARTGRWRGGGVGADGVVGAGAPE